ncbi:DUF892 family protein [Rhizomonospora bruguierae]|uniref:DUF892 family protein n=1 Tax=Rhizomonospora bruguierae TaxID=1581705 RepID=UPI001BCA842D|nr:DUF892 family protein [Micromonospora sp. NBRC 107566]
MAITDPAELFLYDLSVQYDAEAKAAALLGAIRDRVGDGPLAESIQREEQHAQNRLRELDACFGDLRSTPANASCETVDGMHREFDRFVSLNPAYDALQMYAAGAAQKFSRFGVGSYRSLVDEAMQMGETGVVQRLQTNLLRVERCASKMECVKHDVTGKVLAPV